MSKRMNKETQRRILQIFHEMAEHNDRLRKLEVPQTPEESEERRRLRRSKKALEDELHATVKAAGAHCGWQITQAATLRYDWFFEVAPEVFDRDLLEEERARENWWRKDNRVALKYFSI